jgi:C4-dicarboxylate-binding protein DctP
MKNKALLSMLCAMMVMGLAACNKSSGTVQQATGTTTETRATYTLRVGMPTAGQHFSNFTAEQFKAALEAATNGGIVVQIYPSSQLGTAVQMIQGVQDASIEGVIIPSSYFAPFAPAVAVTDIPYFFENHQQIFEILNSPENPLNAYLEKYGFKVAGWLKNTPRYIMSQKKYASLRDLANQKIWSLPSDTLQNELKAYTAAPQILDPADISVALENRTVDGVETDVIFMNSMGLGKSAKFLNQIPATPMVNLFCLSQGWFDKLPADYQQLVLTTAQDIIMNKEAAYVDTVYEASLVGLQGSGVEIVQPTEAFLTELTAVAQSVKDSFIKTDAECNSIFQTLQKMIAAKSN